MERHSGQNSCLYNRIDVSIHDIDVSITDVHVSIIDVDVLIMYRSSISMFRSLMFMYRSSMSTFRSLSRGVTKSSITGKKGSRQDSNWCTHLTLLGNCGFCVLTRIFLLITWQWKWNWKFWMPKFLFFFNALSAGLWIMSTAYSRAELNYIKF